MCITTSECILATCPKLNSDSAGDRRKVPGWSKEVEHLKQDASAGAINGKATPG